MNDGRRAVQALAHDAVVHSEGRLHWLVTPMSEPALKLVTTRTYAGIRTRSWPRPASPANTPSRAHTRGPGSTSARQPLLVRRAVAGPDHELVPLAILLPTASRHLREPTLTTAPSVRTHAAGRHGRRSPRLDHGARPRCHHRTPAVTWCRRPSPRANRRRPCMATAVVAVQSADRAR